MITIIYNNGKPKDNFNAISIRFNGNTLIISLAGDNVKEVWIDIHIISTILLWKKYFQLFANYLFWQW